MNEDSERLSAEERGRREIWAKEVLPLAGDGAGISSLVRRLRAPVSTYLGWRQLAARRVVRESRLDEVAAFAVVDEPDSAFHDLYWRARDAGFSMEHGGAYDELLRYLYPLESRRGGGVFENRVDYENWVLNAQIAGEDLSDDWRYDEDYYGQDFWDDGVDYGDPDGCEDDDDEEGWGDD